MMTPGDHIRIGIVSAFAAGIGVAIIAGLAFKPEPAKPKPLPTETPNMQWFLDANGPNGGQAGRDLQSLGKISPEHDRWILQNYGPPKPKPKPAPKTRAAPLSQDG